jgi:hypothetical protein
MLQGWFALGDDEKRAIRQKPPVEVRQQLIDKAKEQRIAAPKRPNLAELEHVAPKLKSRIDALRKQKKEPAARKIEEARWLLDHTPEPVDPAKLAHFEASLPPWVGTQLDPMPPEVARRRLMILYRIVFPAGTEMPEPAPAKQGQPKPPAAPPPAPAGGSSF